MAEAQEYFTDSYKEKIKQGYERNTVNKYGHFDDWKENKPSEVYRMTNTRYICKDIHEIESQIIKLHNDFPEKVIYVGAALDSQIYIRSHRSEKDRNTC